MRGSTGAPKLTAEPTTWSTSKGACHSRSDGPHVHCSLAVIPGSSHCLLPSSEHAGLKRCQQGITSFAGAAPCHKVQASGLSSSSASHQLPHHAVKLSRQTVKEHIQRAPALRPQLPALLSASRYRAASRRRAARRYRAALAVLPTPLRGGAAGALEAHRLAGRRRLRCGDTRCSPNSVAPQMASAQSARTSWQPGCRFAREGGCARAESQTTGPGDCLPTSCWRPEARPQARGKQSCHTSAWA